MKHISLTILTLFFLVIGVAAQAATPLTPIEKMKALPTFERATRIIKYYETLHVGKGNIIGYGHVIQKGEPYKIGVDLNETEADALLRSDLTKFIHTFRAYAPYDTLLAVLAYNVGPARVLRSHLLKTIAMSAANNSASESAARGRSASDSAARKKLASDSEAKKMASERAAILREYLSFSHYRGKPHAALRRRRYLEFTLLSPISVV